MSAAEASERKSTKPQLSEDLDLEELSKYFNLSPTDLLEVQECRGSVNRVGFAIQLCCLRWFGFLLADLEPTPAVVVAILVQQLQISDTIDLALYAQSKNTVTYHQERIREYLGFQKCDEHQRFRLLSHLAETVVELPRTADWLDVACNWLYAQKIVRPATRTLQDIITDAKNLGMDRVYTLISESLTDDQKRIIDKLVEGNTESQGGFSAIEELRKPAKRESVKSMNELVTRLERLQALQFAADKLKLVPLPTKQMLASWGYKYDVWSLRRFEKPKCHSIVVAFLAAALADTTDAIVDMYERLNTHYHNKAREKKDSLIHEEEEARTIAITAFEDIGTIVVNDIVEDKDVRTEIFRVRSKDNLRLLLETCRSKKLGDLSHLGFVSTYYGEMRKYSPQLLRLMPYNFKENSDLAEAVDYLNKFNESGKKNLGNDAPTAFLSKRWRKHVIRKVKGKESVSKPDWEAALHSTIVEQTKAGEVTYANSRRWGDLEDLLIPVEEWSRTRLNHYQKLKLPVDSVEQIAKMREALESITATVNQGVPTNTLLKIDREKGTFVLSPFKGGDVTRARRIKQLRTLILSELPKVDLVRILIDLDSATGFLRHFVTPALRDTRLSASVLKANAIAALIAIGCNIGPYRMALATPGITHSEISAMADWFFTPENLKAACIDLVNYGFALPITKTFGSGETCSADGMRFYSPSNLLRTDFSPALKDRGITMVTHTADNLLMLHQQPIPCKMREAAYDLDGLLQHDTELDPTRCFTDTHGYTEAVLGAASLVGYELAPRIKDIKDKTLYRFERAPNFSHVDPIIKGTIKTPLIHTSWDEIVRVMASMKSRRVSASLILTRLSSYARQNSVYLGLRELGRVNKTKLILRCLHDEDFRRLQIKEINKGERSHDLDRFIFFGKQGALRSREFADQSHSFSCLAILHNAIIVWNLTQLPAALDRLRAKGHVFTDDDTTLVGPLLWANVNPLGHYDINPDRLSVSW